MKLFHALWKDEAGFVVSAELVLIATVLVIGLLVGLATIRDNIVMELADVADAFSEIVQSYSFSGITGHSSSTSGSLFADAADFCETGTNVTDQSANAAVNCLAIVAGVNE